MYTSVHLDTYVYHGKFVYIKQSQHFDPSPKTDSVTAELLNDTLSLETLVRGPKTLNLISINRRICVYVFARV